MYICVKLTSRDLNSNPYPPHLTNTYTCGVTIAPRVCSGQIIQLQNTPKPLKITKITPFKPKKKWLKYLQNLKNDRNTPKT